MGEYRSVEKLRGVALHAVDKSVRNLGEQQERYIHDITTEAISLSKEQTENPYLYEPTYKLSLGIARTSSFITLYFLTKHSCAKSNLQSMH